jgi:tetratricopeptide (TPR) repeat protein
VHPDPDNVRANRKLQANTWLLLLVPAIAFLALHLRTLDYGFVWTDETEIEAGALVVPLDDLHLAFTEPRKGDLSTGQAWAYYRPLQVVAVSVIHDRAGAAPWAYRLPSLLMGAFTASIFAAFAFALLGRTGPALFAALVPALHPAGLEIYVWIAGLSESMSSFFLVGSLACAISWVRDRSGQKRLALLASCLVLFVLALASKESAAVLPGLVLAWMAGDALARTPSTTPTLSLFGFETPRRAAGLLAGLGILALTHLLVLRPAVVGSATLGMVPIGGDRVTHLLTAISTWLRSIGWLLLPIESSASDVVDVVGTAADPRPWLGLLLLVVSVALWALLASRRFTTAAFGLAWIWIAFLPTANLIPSLHAVAERNIFFSTFGLGLMLAELGPALLSRLRAPAFVAPLAASLLIAGLAQRTFARTPDWQSTISLFEGDVARDPGYREGRYWLAGALLKKGRAKEAIAHLETLIPQIAGVPGKASYLRGDPRLMYCHALLDAGEYDRAERFLRALRGSHPKRAASPTMRNCLGGIYEGQGRHTAALGIYRKLLETTARENPWLQVAAARCYANLGQTAKAEEFLERLPAQADRPPELERDVVGVQRLLGGAG